MRLKFGHLSRYAESSQLGLTLIGIFDYITVPKVPGEERIQLPLFYLSALVGATSFEAGKHPIVIRLIDADGVEGGRMEAADATFEAHEPGRELGTYIVAPVLAMSVPRYGDYVFEVWGGSARLGTIDVVVREPVGVTV